MEAALLSGFIKSLHPRLLSLLVEGKYKLHKALKGDIESIVRDLQINAFAIDDQIQSGCESDGAVLRVSIGELRQLAYEIEDCVDRFLYLVTREQQQSLFRRSASSLMMSHQRLAAEVQRLKRIVQEAPLREKRYRVLTGLSPSSLHADSSSFSFGSDLVGIDAPRKELMEQLAEEDQGLPKQLKVRPDLVGIDAPLEELTEQLTEEDQGLPKLLKVISIVGIHGSGKTTLTRELYESDAARRFILRAWISVANRGPIEVLTQILRILGRPVQDSSNLDQLLIELSEYLGSKRYFIVMDDMQTDQWSAIKYAFPKDNTVSSRVIVTTTIKSVAYACSSSNGYVHKMKRLNVEHSKQLFTKIACPKEYRSIIVPHSNVLLNKCDGQPLALVSVGQFMRKMGWPTGPSCEDICRYLGYHLAQDETLGRMWQVLIHSFFSLPSYASRACLLYFCMFPSEYPVRRKSLMRLWLTEGFVDSELSASAIFEMLMDQNIIEPIRLGYKDNVKTCKTYGMMREFILQMSTSQDFITLFSDDRIKDKYVGRLSLHHNTSKGCSSSDMDVSVVRSLMVFGEAGKAFLSFQKYQLLRVLDLEHCTNLEDYHLKDICNLLLLKYLSLGVTVTELPKDIKKLKFLNTLDLRRTMVNILPIEILMLPCLVHLLGRFQLSDKIKKTSDMKKFLLSGQSKVETLAGFVTNGYQGFAEIMSYMLNLKKVKIWFESSERSTSTTHLEHAIKKFIHDDMEDSNNSRSLSLHFSDCTERVLDSLQAPCCLRSLKLKGKLLGLPQFVVAMRGLRELCLSSTTLTSGLLAALSNLTSLQHLKLVADELQDFIIKDWAFPRLLNLCFVLHRATIPTIEEGALPFLVSFKLICKDLIGLAGIKINCFRCLKEVTLDYGVTSETIKSWEEAAKEHPNRPKVLFFQPC